MNNANVDRDRSFGFALKTVGIVGGLFAVGGVLVGDLRTCASVFTGALIGFLNLWALGRIVRAVTREPEAGTDAENGPSTSVGVWSLLALLKIVFLFGGTYLLMARGQLSPLPLVVGYGALPFGIMCATLFTKAGFSR